MKKAQKIDPYTPSAEALAQQDEQWKKSIPAQVFLNYFVALHYHIQHNQEPGLQELSFFQQQRQIGLSPADEEALRKLLLSCWSTEFALRSTAELGNTDYLRHALHWTFPQAYYSVLAGLQAFLLTQNFRSRNPEAIARQQGRLVLQRAYPRAVGYYAAGPYPEVSVHRLPLSGYKAGLQLPEQELEAQAQIGQFLRTSRRLRAQTIRRELQGNPQTALRSPKTGKILEKWNKSHWQQISWRLGYTTYFDLLSRLRISGSHKEIDRFVEAEIDFTLFHKSLLGVVAYLNGLHEAYVAKALGLENYRELVTGLPPHLQGGFVTARLNEKVAPLLTGAPEEGMDTAA